MDKKKSVKLLLVALLLCVFGAMMAGLIQSSFGDVKVENVSIVTGEGRLTGYLLIPNNATQKTPAPAIVTSHGYLNNKEMQDISYVELSRRGFVVFAMDAYNHGNSSVPPKDGDPVMLKSGGMISAVEYLWQLPFVDNSRIGVMGHSMGGGFADAVASYYTTLEKKALSNGMDPQEARKLNKVAATLIVGNVPLKLLTSAQTEALKSFHTAPPGNAPYFCEIGVIYARYDEFGMWVMNGSFLDFFSQELPKTFVSLQTGDKSILQVPEIQEGRRYVNSNTGFGIRMYSPIETHAMNTFSRKTSSETIEFFTDALKAPRQISSDNQIWWLKEFFNFIGLIGFFLLIVPLTDLLLEMPFFSGLRSKQVSLVPAMNDKKQKLKYYIASVFNMLAPAVLYIPLMAIGFLALVKPFWPQDTTGGIALWSFVCGLVALLIVRITNGKFKGRGKELGIGINRNDLGKTILLAFLITVGAFTTVFVANYFFKTDFRIWTFAIHTFSASKIWVAFAYLPFFLVFYIANSILISRNRFENWSERKQIFVSIFGNIIGVIIVLLVQYIPCLFTGMTLLASVGNSVSGPLGTLLSVGGALFPIVLYPFVPILAIVAVFNIKIYKRTGNAYLAGMINALLVTMLTVANTSFKFPY